MVHGLTGKTYEEKLAELKLDSLETRRRKADLIQAFKIIRGFNDVDRSTWFEFANQNNTVIQTRSSSHPLNLRKKRCNTEIKKNFFSNRVVDDWNALPSHVKESSTIKLFKANLTNINY